MRHRHYQQKKKLRYQTGPPFFEKVNVEVTNQFQSCKKYGPLHVSDEQTCLKFPVYGAKLHIGKNVECISRAHNDQMGSDFMTKKTTALKWRFPICTTDPPAFTSRSLPRKVLTMCPISMRKNSFRRVAQAIKTIMPSFSHSLLYSTKQKRKPACGISLQASVQSCLPDVMSGTKAPRHQREGSCLKIVFIFNCQPSDILHIHNINTTDRSPCSEALDALQSELCPYFAQSTKMSVKPSET